MHALVTDTRPSLEVVLRDSLSQASACKGDIAVLRKLVATKDPKKIPDNVVEYIRTCTDDFSLETAAELIRTASLIKEAMDFIRTTPDFNQEIKRRERAKKGSGENRSK